MRHILVAATVMALMAGGAGRSRSAPARAEDSPPAEPTGIIVTFDEGTTLDAVGQALDASHTDVQSSTTIDNVAVLEPEPGQTVLEAVTALVSNSAVTSVEPDYTVNAEIVPNDARFSTQWAPRYIDLPNAWNITTGSPDVVIAVVDTGVDLTHPELADNLVEGYSAIDDGPPEDENGHGTHVAGIIAARGNDGTGVAGVCWSCKIMPIKVLDADGSGLLSDTAEGVIWAADHGADVINLSLGAKSGNGLIRRAVDYADSKGIIVVAGAGNNNGKVLYPAAYTSVIAVGAFDSKGKRASFSNFGRELDILGPGVGILSAAPGGGYASWSGTSQASPHVAGVVALMFSNGMTDKEAIRSRLLATATDAGTEGPDPKYGNGLLNAERAVELTAPIGGGPDATAPTVSITSPRKGATVRGTAMVTAKASDKAGVAKVEFYANGALIGTDPTAPYSVRWNTASVPNGAITIEAKAWDRAGNAGTSAVTVTVSNAGSAPPAVSISSPSRRSTVSASITIAATASSGKGVQRVQFAVDYLYLGEDTSTPYRMPLDTTRLGDGTHSIRVLMTDRSGTRAEQTITVTVDNTP